MKTIEVIITQSKTTKVSIKIPEGLSPKDEYQFINRELNEDDMYKLILDYPSEEIDDINEITSYDIT